MTIKAYGQTHVGMRRENNEDCYLIDEPLGLYLVCDGMGGHHGGEIASREACQAVQGYVKDHADRLAELTETSDMEAIQNLVVESIQHASRIVRSDAERFGMINMGTTLTLLLTVGDRAVIASVGDSRAYHCRRNVATLLTTDHTLANDMLISGEFSRDEARDSPFNHYLTRVVGYESDVKVDTLVANLVPGDVFLLCTDGLTNYFESDHELGKFMFHEPATIPAKLISHANSSGGKDNITAVVVHVGVEAGPPRWKWKSWFARVA